VRTARQYQPGGLCVPGVVTPAQPALTLALARRPRLLLGEPMAMLDPVARHDFMATVLTAAADDGVSVLLSLLVRATADDPVPPGKFTTFAVSFPGNVVAIP